jgi:hypothetical protein
VRQLCASFSSEAVQQEKRKAVQHKQRKQIQQKQTQNNET